MVRQRSIPLFAILGALLALALMGPASQESMAAAYRLSTPAPTGSDESNLQIRILKPAAGTRLSDPVIGVQVEASGGPFVEVLLFADGSVVDHLNPEKDASFKGTLVWKGAPPGKHHLKVMAVDWNKNTAQAETDIEVIGREPGGPAKAPEPEAAPVPAPAPQPTPAPTQKGFYVRFLNVTDGGAISVQTGGKDFPHAVVALETGFSGAQHVLPFQILLDADGMCLGPAVNYDKAFPFKAEYTWRPLRGNGKYLLVARAVSLDRKTETSVSALVNVVGFLSSRPAPLDVIKQVYQNKYGLALSAPAVARFNNTGNPSESMWVSTAYIGDTLYEVDLWDSARTFANTRSLNNARQYPACRPSGRLTILVVFLDYRNTRFDRDTMLKALRTATAKANGFYSQYAAAHGWKTPILQLDVTGAYVTPPPSPGELLKVGQIKSLTGLDPTRFDMLFEVDLDSAHTYKRPAGMEVAGGITFRGCDGTPAHDINIWMELGNDNDPVGYLHLTLLDHELAHAMGWQHEWPIGDGGTATTREWVNGIQLWPVLLFGWTDTDGDGIPEILDPTPYGLRK